VNAKAKLVEVMTELGGVDATIEMLITLERATAA
jgi:hypothetical protein